MAVEGCVRSLCIEGNCRQQTKPLYQTCFYYLYATGKFERGYSRTLRILAMYEAKNSKICNFWTFWPVIQLIKKMVLSRAREAGSPFKAANHRTDKKL